MAKTINGATGEAVEKALRTSRQDLEQKVRERTAELEEANRRLQENEQRYRFLYDFSPVALAEMDCAGVKSYLEELSKKGVTDFRSYFESHPQALAECAAKRRMIAANNAMVALFKAGTKERLIENGTAIFTSASYRSFCEGLIAYAEGKETFESEIVGRTFDGEERFLYLKWSILPGFERSRTRMLGCLIDITHRKALVDELTLFKTAADRAGFGNVIVDHEHRVLYANQAFARMHGYEVNEVIGQPVQMFHTEEQTEEIKKWGRRLRKGTVLNMEIWHKRRDGTLFPTLMSGTLIVSETGAVPWTYSSTVDISELKRVQTALQERERELEANNIKLQEMNTALKVLLQSREMDKVELEQKVMKNVKELCLPVVEKLRNSGLEARQQAYVEVLESSLKEVVSPFVHALSNEYPGLTPAEIGIANLIKEGKSSEEIGDMLNLSKRSVDTYRNRIRKKLGIDNKKINLRTHLLRLR